LAKKRKKIPKFKSEKQEREFWLKHDSSEYLELSEFKPAVFQNLKPTTKTISIRLPETLLAELKILANKRDVPYQSLLKTFLAERVSDELKPSGSKK
jgi:predicted DNA binding CopG/RHH family protein